MPLPSPCAGKKRVWEKGEKKGEGEEGTVPYSYADEVKEEKGERKDLRS